MTAGNLFVNEHSKKTVLRNCKLRASRKQLSAYKFPNRRDRIPEGKKSGKDDYNKTAECCSNDHKLYSYVSL